MIRTRLFSTFCICGVAVCVTIGAKATPAEPAAAQAGATAQAAPPPQGRGGDRPARPPRVRARKVVLAWADTRNGQAQHEFTSHALSVI